MANICHKARSQIGDLSTIEDYLEAIMVLSRETGGAIRVTDLSERLGVSKPSVSAAVKKLAEARLVAHERYGDIRLTVAGLQQAARVASCHDLLHRFLAEILGVDDQTAEEDACRMEHDLSAETVSRLAQFVEFLVGGDLDHDTWDRNFEHHLAQGTHHADLVKKRG